MKIGVYVGSFNPVHIGHKKIIDHLLYNDYLDKVIVVPTEGYWDKTNLIDIKHRINMLKFYENKNILINDYLNNCQYTYQILNRLKEENPKDVLYLIIGADNIVKFKFWENVEEILKNKILVFNRDDIEIQSYIDDFLQKDNFVIINNFQPISISSTEIRNNLDDMSEYLDKKIYKYIKDNDLYSM